MLCSEWLTRVPGKTFLIAASLAMMPLHLFARTKPANAVILNVSPEGDDRVGDGSAAHPFQTLARAQQAVRLSNRQHNVEVLLHDGTYRLSRTLRFTAADGGQNGYTVVWHGAPGAHPVISGALSISGWSPDSKHPGIFVASVPKGLNSRDLWIDDHLAPIAHIELRRTDYTFNREGMTAKSGAIPLPDLSNAKHMEIRATGFFTFRVSPVSSAQSGHLVMRQPAWDNNLWGYDTIERPFHPELQHLYLANALPLLARPGQWYLDSDSGKLYVRPATGANIHSSKVELPRLAVLISIGNSLAQPVHDLSFRGLQFSYTTWLGPSGPEGYASQQSGSFITGRAAAYPSDPIATCSQGCPAFESMRNLWNQMPASIQLSAGNRISFQHDIFAHLGQYALGIGNDADAMISGTGLGAGDILVSENDFHDCAGGAILAGGVRATAHHPPERRQTNQQIIVRDNYISSVSEDFLDNAAILSTYVTGAVILHNDISNVPYDAIDIGYGWGIEDAGGNPNYEWRMRGYQWSQNPIYETPTTYREVVVSNNRIHNAKQLFQDGGAIYNLSASPNTLITENYIFDNHGRIGIYLDEGSRFLTVRRNVVQDADGEWLNINTVHAIYPIRISSDNTAIGNWHDSTKIGGMWTNFQDDLILDDHPFTGTWPADAKEVMHDAGVEPNAHPPSDPSLSPEQVEPGKHPLSATKPE